MSNSSNARPLRAPLPHEQQAPAPLSGQSEKAPSEPTNIIPGPGAVDSSTAKTAPSKLSQALNLLDTLELLFAELSVEDARKATPRLLDLANTVCEYVAEPGPVAKAPAKKAA